MFALLIDFSRPPLSSQCFSQPAPVDFLIVVGIHYPILLFPDAEKLRSQWPDECVDQCFSYKNVHLDS